MVTQTIEKVVWFIRMARKLTERQQKFIDALFAEANGSVKDAKIIAGYSPNTNNHEIIKAMKLHSCIGQVMHLVQQWLW